jgi:hypothetical protein
MERRPDDASGETFGLLHVKSMRSLRNLLAVLLGGMALFAVLPTGHGAELNLDLVETDLGIAVMRHEVTIAEWQVCVVDSGCSYAPAPGLGATNGGFPVTGIGALDAMEFEAWAQRNIDPALRLPTRSEWYAMSGIKPYVPDRIFTDPRLAWAATYGSGGKIDPTLKPSGGFGANTHGIADVAGNVWEWTSTCVIEAANGHCPAYFAAGEHDANVPVFVRDPTTGGCATGIPPAHFGLRLVSARARRVDGDLQTRLWSRRPE